MSKSIEPDRHYTIADMAREKVLPFAISFVKIRSIVENDRKKKNLLKAIVMGDKTHTRYWIKGKNIINFLAHWEDGSNKIY